MNENIPSRRCKPAMCHPNFVRVVAGIILITAGTSKFIGGVDSMEMTGGAVLRVFGGEGLGVIAIIMGYIAALIQLIGGLLFALGCGKMSQYASFALAIVMFAAVLVQMNNMPPIPTSGFNWFSEYFSQIQLPLLLFALFLQKSLSLFTGSPSCCAPVTKKCCDSLTQSNDPSCRDKKSCCNTSDSKMCCNSKNEKTCCSMREHPLESTIIKEKSCCAKTGVEK